MDNYGSGIGKILNANLSEEETAILLSEFAKEIKNKKENKSWEEAHQEVIEKANERAEQNRLNVEQINKNKEMNYFVDVLRHLKNDSGSDYLYTEQELRNMTSWELEEMMSNLEEHDKVRLEAAKKEVEESKTVFKEENNNDLNIPSIEEAKVEEPTINLELDKSEVIEPSPIEEVKEEPRKKVSLISRAKDAILGKTNDSAKGVYESLSKEETEEITNTNNIANVIEEYRPEPVVSVVQNDAQEIKKNDIMNMIEEYRPEMQEAEEQNQAGISR